jgi:Ca-activated chloride channel homolog
MGNYKDGLMETLSNKGNGNYAYIDNQVEARKVMVEQLSGTLVTIAKDVKIQVEFNPKFVESYRLVGYENRLLKNEDFNNDAKDAGDIGAGHTVTALYEIVPTGTIEAEENTSIDSLKYQKQEKKTVKAVRSDNDSNELLTLKIRYKKPDGDVSAKQEFPLLQQENSFEKTSESFKFSSAVALFGMLLRNSEHVQDGSYEKVLEVAKKSKGDDKNQYRQEFIELVKKVEGLKVLPQQAYLEE